MSELEPSPTKLAITLRDLMALVDALEGSLNVADPQHIWWKFSHQERQVLADKLRNICDHRNVELNVGS